eukprot:IDg13311t1
MASMMSFCSQTFGTQPKRHKQDTPRVSQSDLDQDSTTVFKQSYVAFYKVLSFTFCYVPTGIFLMKAALCSVSISPVPQEHHPILNSTLLYSTCEIRMPIHVYRASRRYHTAIYMRPCSVSVSTGAAH